MNERNQARECEIVKLVKDGFTNSQIAKILGINKGTVWHSIERLGMHDKNRPEQGILFVQKYAPTFEYVGGYEGKDKPIQIKHKVCGHVLTASCNSIRHGYIPKCSFCVEREKAIEKNRLEEERTRKRIEAEKKKQERDEERERKARERMHDCPVCGEITTRPIYCSKKCANKVAMANHDIRRRMRIAQNMIDTDITLSALYKKDGGVCYICGGLCRYDDFVVKDGIKITGDWYPSIDHVQPLSKGGEHSWENVRLAHRKCNYIKSDNPRH